MIITPLMQHQYDALMYLKAHDPCALFMRQGIGKSLVALTYAHEIKAKCILITSDKTNIVQTWPEQIEAHTDATYVVRPTKETYEGATFVLVNYDYLPSCQWLRGVPFDLWIGDESSEFKDGRTRRHKHLDAIVHKIPHRIILNGTPLTEQAEDLWGQFKILDGGLALGSCISHFRSRFMQLDRLGYNWNLKRSGMTRIQRAIKERSYWHDGKGITMPTRKYHRVTVNMTDKQRELDDELKKWYAAEFQRSRIEVKHAAVLFIKRIQLMGGIFRPTISPEKESQQASQRVTTNKLDVLNLVIARNKKNKIVVWHEYIPETELLHDTLKGGGYNLWVYDDSSDVTPLIKFQEAKSGVLLIRNSFCKGLNALADGDIAVIWSNPLSYRDRSQLLGRTCRMSSKTRETHVVDIITKGGADEIVYNMLSQKQSFVLTTARLRSIVEEHK